jgi:hypothetical protein
LKREALVWGLIIASGVCGLLFGGYCKIYALIPAALVIAGIAYFLASRQGLAIGVLSLVLAAVAMQLCYFLSAAITIFMENIKPAKAPSEEFLYRFESAKWFKETAPARGLGELRPPCRGVPWGERHASDVGLAICHRH